MRGIVSDENRDPSALQRPHRETESLVHLSEHLIVGADLARSGLFKLVDATAVNPGNPAELEGELVPYLVNLTRGGADV